MTVREVYDNLLTELNKVEAPSLLLESFNYYLGKSINEVCNQWYAFYEQNQLLKDNLRVLTRSSARVKSSYNGMSLYTLPDDYWHLLPGSVLSYSVVPSCTGESTIFEAPVISLDSQMYSGIIKDYYTKPSYKRPYLYMHEIVVTTGSNPGVTTTYDIQIKSGATTKYTPTTLQLDYLKKPKLPNRAIKDAESQDLPSSQKNLYLTTTEIDSDTGDISALMEFPENFCYEIINKLTALVLEQTGDTNRLQVNTPLNQTMMPPKQG
jgi:hypothetical protein